MDKLFKRFKSIFKAEGKSLFQLGFKPGVLELHIDAAEARLNIRFPISYRKFIEQFNGHDYEILNWLPDNMSFLELDEVIKVWENEMDFYDEMESESFFNRYSEDGKTRLIFYHPRRIPIADLEGECTLYLDFIPGPEGTEGQVIYNINESDFVVLAKGFKDFLSRYVQLHESGELVLERYQDGYALFSVVKTRTGLSLNGERFIELMNRLPLP